MLASEHDAVAIASSTPLYDVTNDPVKLLMLDLAAVKLMTELILFFFF